MPCLHDLILVPDEMVSHGKLGLRRREEHCSLGGRKHQSLGRSEDCVLLREKRSVFVFKGLDLCILSKRRLHVGSLWLVVQQYIQEPSEMIARLFGPVPMERTIIRPMLKALYRCAALIVVDTGPACH